MERDAPLANVDLNLLKALDALLRERSVTRAAARLSVTQPSMSGALARLRALFGDEILVRSGRSMRPTTFAESLEAPVRDILARVEQAVLSRAAFDPKRDTRSFTLLATDYPVVVLLRPLIASLALDAPGVRIDVETARPSELHSRRSLEESDLAIVPSAVGGTSSLPTKALFADRFVGAVWRGNDEVGDALTLETLRRLPYLSFRQAGRATMSDRHLEQLGCPLEPSAVVESFVTGALLLRGTIQAAFLPERLGRELEDVAELRLMEPPVELPRIAEAMVWHPRASGDPAHHWPRGRLVELAAELSRPA